jgi:hypothetical protein
MANAVQHDKGITHSKCIGRILHSKRVGHYRLDEHDQCGAREKASRQL